ncbi:glycosyltransferase family 2 protein [Flavihumibacter sp. CACIAM 22H1]|uniref:glycosyltransferase family 2 protein n=1 Tax=Flavihumibacter sp. CACIAM 22H1 TaxID=1812911 RepID=UPI0007A8E4A3|nr:glycosyltransferase family 2 protein [Flavihumibacter sp. CACIAM 22H1]KYP15965.1 MAG: hypothetical protein A1D16_06805 [Flavihumibacter sp. CACIAM 22H1]
MSQVSVIMPVYNAEKYLTAAIQSVLQQTYSDLELVIVNDGSTDKTDAIIKSFTDKRIKYYNLGKNYGRGYARNFAVSNCSGNYIAVCDADDINLPERIEKQVNFLEKNPQIHIVGTQILHFVDDHAPGKIYHFPETPALIDQKFKRGEMGIAHCSVLLRKHCFSKNKYDDSLAYSVEDLELFLRLNRQFQMASLPDALVLYRNNQFKRINLQQIAFHQLYHDYSLHISAAKLEKRAYLPFDQWAEKKQKKASFKLSYWWVYLKLRIKLLLLNFKR